MKKTYIILRKLSKEEEQKIIEEANSSEIRLLLEQSSYISSGSATDLNCLELDLAELSNRTHQEHLERIAQLGAFEFAGKTLHEHLEFKGRSLWLYLKFSVFHRSLPKVQDLVKLKFLMAQYKADAYTVFVSQPLPDEFLKGVEQRLLSKAKGKQLTYLLKYGFLFFLRTFLGLVQLPFRLKRKSSDLILLNPYNLQKIYDRAAKKKIKMDPHLGYLIEESRADDNFLLLSQLRAINFQQKFPLRFADYFRLTKDSGRTLFFEPFLFFAFLTSSFYRNLNAQRYTVAEFKRNLKESSFEDELVYISMMATAEVSRMLAQAIWREEAAKILAYWQKIRSLTLIDEHSLKNRSLWFPLKKKGAKVIAVQHGAISEGNIAYKFSEVDRRYDALPDLTLIRGEFTKRMLSERSIYSHQELAVVGHMRTDLIPALLNKQSSKEGDRPKILYATQPLPASEQKLKERQLNDFFAACKALPDHDFIIKPHPNEGDPQLYLRSAAALQLNNFSLKTEDLYQQLAEADLVITYYSTVGIEAIYFGKPLITLDYHQYDLQSYLSSGVSINVKSGEQLTNSIRGLLKGDLKLDKEKLNAFISERAYRIDGKATERHFSAIKKKD